MTYIQQRSAMRARYGARRARGMGGLFDVVEDLVAGATGVDPRGAREVVCGSDADAAVASMSSQINDVERTWNPTGFYSADQLATVIEQTLAYSQTARSQMTSALESVDIDDSGKEASRREFDAAYADFQTALDRSAIFIEALHKARTSGARAIDAPGLKAWVVQVLKGSQKLARAAAFVACNVSSFERFVRAVNNAVDRLLSVLKTIGGIVLAAGEKAIGVAFDFAGLMLSIAKYAPYVLIAGGGLFLYRQYRDR